jgi:hypothetical protein
MTPAQFWALEQNNQQNRQENQQQQMNQVFSAMGQLAGAYNDQENMKATVKSGEKLLDVMGPSFGMTADKLKEFDYSNMSMREKAMFHQGWQGNFATMSQAHNFGNRLGVQQDQPFVNQGLQNARNLGAGNVPYGAADPANTVPLPTDDPLPAVASTPPAVTARPGLQNMTREQWDAMNEDLVRLGRQSRGPYPY